MTKKSLAVILKLCFVAALFALIFKPQLFGMKSLFGDVAPLDVWQALRSAGETGPAAFFFFMACAVVVKLLGISAGIVRWRLLLGGQNLRIPVPYLAYQWFMGRTIGLILPGTLGLDGYRLVESSRYTREPVKCAAVIAVEKLTGIIALSFLVFITFPLGFRFFHYNMVLLAGIMAVLFCGVAGSLLLLLNPRVIQVLISIMPAPFFARNLINKLGQAATAYGHNKKALLAALFFGILVHLGTCSKYFFTFMAIRAANVSVADIFFVSPLMITASVLAFTISGLGVREVAFGLVLGSSAGHAVAILGGHLGLWAGEIIPFVLSIPLLLLGGRPRREILEADRAYVSEQLGAKGRQPALLLTAEEILRYRKQVFSILALGALMGVLAGMLIVVLESSWIVFQMPEVENWGLFFWGALTYSFIFAAVGAAIAGGMLFVFLLLDWFPVWSATAALIYATTFAFGGLVIGMFRYGRDLLDGHAMTPRDYAILLTLMLGLSLILGVIAFAKMEVARQRLRFTVPRMAIACLAGWLISMGVIGAVSTVGGRKTESIAFAPEQAAAGPNIVLCAIDALRADCLRMYNPQSEVETPHLDVFAKDSILFQQAFSQASWTKPSFGTVFTGLYPSAHGATTKTAALTKDCETLAELLSHGGYFTKGFSNNPNMTKVFGMHRGFSDYVDLKPDYLFGAPESAMHLSLYGLLRKAKMRGERILFGDRLRITDYYQPAEAVTRIALEWFDSAEQPKDAPFYLYLHYMDTHDPFMQHGTPGVGYSRARMENPNPDKFREPMWQAYLSEIEYLDTYLGKLFQGLKERNLYDNTIIVLFSDHGEEFFDHGGWWHGQTLYEELLRVALMIKLPENEKGGTVNKEIARLVDIAPTILHLAGLKTSSRMSGQSLYDRSGMFTNAGIAYSFAENDFEGNQLQAVRTRDRALIEANEDSPRGMAPVELYDMTKDPKQQQNVAVLPEYQEDLKKLGESVAQYLRMIMENAPEPTENAQLDPQLRQQLEALGYL